MIGMNWRAGLTRMAFCVGIGGASGCSFTISSFHGRSAGRCLSDAEVQREVTRTLTAVCGGRGYNVDPTQYRCVNGYFDFQYDDDMCK